MKSQAQAPSGDRPSLAKFLGEGPALIEAYLQEQHDLTAVERFSQAHDKLHLGGRPHLESHYKELIPLEKPRPGQQYGFEVDLDRCTGCKACVTACHNLNGLDPGETWRAVGLIHSVSGKPMQQTVTTACQHCLEPACSHGCPVNAYEKDPVTGIVKHLDDQCIGCQYCILKCPYDVPQYHEEKGIVRKCDMCIGRLEEGEAPACVQACPTKAIRISLVEMAEVRANPRAFTAVAGAPDPAYTLPTTRYKTSRHLPDDMEPADAHEQRREKPHFPLACMLVMSQAAVGFLVLLETAAFTGRLPGGPGFQAIARTLGALLMLAAIAVSIAHLGRPLYAFRAFLGFRRSWLSREIVAFSLFVATALTVAAATLTRAFLPGSMLDGFAAAASGSFARGLLIAAGLLAVHSSAMVYRDTPRILWATRATSARFFLSAAVGGLALALTALAAYAYAVPVAAVDPAIFRVLGAALPIVLIMKLAGEGRVQRHFDDEDNNPLKKAARLLRGELGMLSSLRNNAALAGGILLPLLLIYRGSGAAPAFDLALTLAILALVAAGEFLERVLFFSACIPPRMPGS